MSDQIRVEDLDSDWSLFQCVAWIMFRDPVIVRDSSLDTPRAATSWKSAPLEVEVRFHDDPGSEFAPIEVIERDSKAAKSTKVVMGEEGYSLLRIDVEAAYRIDQGTTPAPVATSKEAQADLLAKLRAGSIQARGTTENDRERLEILPEYWRRRSLIEGRRGVLELSANPFDRRSIWQDVTISRKQMTSTWPPVSKRSRTSNTEKRLAEWLAKQMQASPSQSPGKRAIVSRAQEDGFDITEKSLAFNRAWEAAIEESGATAWKAAGRKRKSP